MFNPTLILLVPSFVVVVALAVELAGILLGACPPLSLAMIGEHRHHGLFVLCHEDLAIFLKEKHLQKVKQLKRQIEEQGEEISDSGYISVLLNCPPTRYYIQISILEAQDDITLAIIINRLHVAVVVR